MKKIKVSKKQVKEKDKLKTIVIDNNDLNSDWIKETKSEDKNTKR